MTTCPISAAAIAPGRLVFRRWPAGAGPRPTRSPPPSMPRRDSRPSMRTCAISATRARAGTWRNRRCANALCRCCCGARTAQRRHARRAPRTRPCGPTNMPRSSRTGWPRRNARASVSCWQQRAPRSPSARMTTRYSRAFKPACARPCCAWANAWWPPAASASSMMCSICPFPWPACSMIQRRIRTLATRHPRQSIPRPRISAGWWRRGATPSARRA